MKILKMKLENFQGVKELEIDPQGESSAIYGDNGTGKSTVYNAFAEQQTAPEPEELDNEEEAKPGKRQQSPDWKTAKTPLEKSFCRFWDAFPAVRKRAKPACWKKWKLIKPDEEMTEHILHAIEVSKQSSDWKRGYVPMPLTWLNQGRWEDISEEVSVNEHSNNGSNAAGSHTAGFHTAGDY